MKQQVTLITRLCIFAAVTLLSAPSNATTWECGERSNLPSEGKNYCAAGDFRQAHAHLEKRFKALLEQHRTKFGDTHTLSSAQSAFESYRDLQCAAENKRIEDKAYHPMLVAQCKTRFTNLRIDELKRMQER